MKKDLKIAIVCAAGIGDGLLMQIAAAHLQKLGCETITFSNHLPALQSWFPAFQFMKQPVIDQIDEIFYPFDAILLQHDNTLKAKKIRSLSKPVYTFYGSHLISKHGPLRPSFDVLFDPTVCMAQNILRGCNVLFPGTKAKLTNGLTPPSHLIFQKYPKRIAIHPCSTSPQKNWSKSSFLKLSHRLLKEGWEPAFIAPPEEAAEWGAPLFLTLADVAAFLYESNCLIGNDSGPGHLASNVGLPTVIIGPNIEHLSFWRPGWGSGEIAVPPRWITEIKLIRSKWRNFISVNQVYKLFMKLNDL